MSTADKELDVVGSLCSKMRLLARCYPYQVRNVVVSSPTTRQDGTSNMSTGLSVMTTADHQQDDTGNEVDGEMMSSSQAWLPSGNIYGDIDDMFSVDDIQWESLLRDFTTGFG